jgi:hypothetical protein
VIKLCLHGTQAGLYVAKRLAICYLGKSHTQVLIETGESFCSMIASVSANAFVELLLGKKVYQL